MVISSACGARRRRRPPHQRSAVWRHHTPGFPISLGAPCGIHALRLDINGSIDPAATAPAFAIVPTANAGRLFPTGERELAHRPCPEGRRSGTGHAKHRTTPTHRGQERNDGSVFHRGMPCAIGTLIAPNEGLWLFVAILGIAVIPARRATTSIGDQHEYSAHQRRPGDQPG